VKNAQPDQVKNLIPHFIQEQEAAGNVNGSFKAYAMFVDMSGFTRLADILMREGSQGAEQLSQILNKIFSPMVSEVYRKGGFIPYFAGDAFTGIFPLESCHCTAGDVLELAHRLFVSLQLVLSKNPKFSLGLKVGLSFGDVEWGIVGNTYKSFYFRGETISGSAQSQVLAKQTQTVADQAFLKQLPAATAAVPLSQQGYFLLTGAASEKAPATGPEKQGLPPSAALSAAGLSRFLPAAVLEFNQGGEFRPVVSVFIAFEGLETFPALNDFATAVLDQVRNYAGYFKEIDFGDKGGVMVIIFGAPVSFENNIERALQFVSSLQELGAAGQLPPLRFKAGVAEGIAYAGIIGGQERSQYAVAGNSVNLAARLMMQAAWDEVLVNESAQKTKSFRFIHRGNLFYKGLEEPMPTFSLVGRQHEQQQQAFKGRMIGREAELRRLEGLAAAAFAGKKAGAAYVFGEAGIGKTRLTNELRQKLPDSRWLTCQSDQILRKPFNPFSYLLRNYFEQWPENSPAQNRESFYRICNLLMNRLPAGEETDAVRREFLRTRSLLAELAGLSLKDPLWDNLDARVRRDNTFIALSSFFQAVALHGPLVVELEDGQWFDDSSIEFLNGFIGKVKHQPVFFLVTSRYDDEGQKPRVFDQQLLSALGLDTGEIGLSGLDKPSMLALGRQILGEEVTPDLTDLLMRTTNGNPFYAEQMLEYLVETQQLAQTETGWSAKEKNVRVSNNVQAVLTARIDRLSRLVRDTIKAAAVIGREFELPVLTEVMRQNEAFSDPAINAQTVLREQVKAAEKAQVWQALNELRYIFRHALLREAVYDMQLKTRLQELHGQIAEAIETLYEGHLEGRYLDLAFHYEQAGVESKTAFYLDKAADYLKNNYQNSQALSYYDKLLVILEKNADTPQIARTLLKKADLLQLTGNWDSCEVANRRALEIATQIEDVKLLGRANNNLGYLLILRGRHEEASRHLDAAAVLFNSIKDIRGNSRVYGNLGTLSFREGKYEDAKLYFIKSDQLAQQYEHTSSKAQIVGNLGLTYMNLGKYDEGIRWQQQQLDKCRKLGDQPGMATLYTNMGIVYLEKGDYDAALRCFEEGLALSEALGNKQLTSIALGSIGTVWLRKGRIATARELFEKDLALTSELGDKQGVAIALGLFGNLHCITGQFDKALEVLQQALSMSRELAYAKGEAKALNTLGDVYYFTGNYSESLWHYDQSIQVTRGIHNALLLGYNLMEKSAVLLALQRSDETAQHLAEALKIARELNHADLLFEVRLLQGKLATFNQDTEKAESFFRQLEKDYPGKEERARVIFELFRLFKKKEDGEMALRIFQELYEGTPVHLYKICIAALESDLAPQKKEGR
jgi:tetratricopeptide (TPR) repeat protein/class 3 adenylate cyclase